MSAAKDTALKGVYDALSGAVSRVAGTYELCLIDANGDAAKEAACKAIRDRSLGFASRAYQEMMEAVNKQWPTEV